MHPLQEMLVEYGVKVRSYSGRGMNGKYCLGVDIERGNLGGFIGDVLEAAQSQVGAENIEVVIDAFREMSTDSMGHGMVAYFPSVPFEVGEVSDEDHEDDS